VWFGGSFLIKNPMPEFESEDPRQEEKILTRRFLFRYALLTIAIFAPLLWAFVTVRNVYPIASWTVMMRGGDLERGHRYFILRGETVSGDTIDIPAVTLTDALYARNWTFVAATVDNQSFRLRSPHPENAALMANAVLPTAARLPELLHAWGDIYNSRLPSTSPQRLKAIRLDAYQWMGQHYSDYDRFIQSWREEL